MVEYIVVCPLTGEPGGRHLDYVRFQNELSFLARAFILPARAV